MSQTQPDRKSLQKLARKETNLIGSLEDIISNYEIEYSQANERRTKKNKKQKTNNKTPIQYEEYSKNIRKTIDLKLTSFESADDPIYTLDDDKNERETTSKLDPVSILFGLSGIAVRGE